MLKPEVADFVTREQFSSRVIWQRGWVIRYSFAPVQKKSAQGKSICARDYVAHHASHRVLLVHGVKTIVEGSILAVASGRMGSRRMDCDPCGGSSKFGCRTGSAVFRRPYSEISSCKALVKPNCI